MTPWSAQQTEECTGTIKFQFGRDHFFNFFSKESKNSQFESNLIMLERDRDRSILPNIANSDTLEIRRKDPNLPPNLIVLRSLNKSIIEITTCSPRMKLIVLITLIVLIL